MRVLIAEDDLTTRTILNGLVRKWGYETEVVMDGDAAWKVLQTPDAPVLVILDWMMPGMDGVDVIRRVREKYLDPPPYMILLTSRDEKGDVLTGLESGANDFIKKPFNNEELFARLRVGRRSVELQQRLFETQAKLSHQASHDSLTGVLNRRAILEQLGKEYARASRGFKNGNSIGLSIGFFDLDDFKRINDQYGHSAGDEVLKAVVEVISKQMRVYDSIGRLGGDEFLVIAPETQAENGELLFERLAKAVAACRIQTSAGEVSVTVSVGVAAVCAGDDLEKFLNSADSALYTAKRSGRNRVEVAGQGQGQG